MINHAKKPAQRRIDSNADWRLIACAHHSRHWKINTAWENLISLERSQPILIIQVDNSAIAYRKVKYSGIVCRYCERR